MAATPFDPASFYEFDLGNGALRTRMGARVTVLSDTVLASLAAAASASGDLTSLRRLGKQLGEHVAASLGEGTSEKSPESVLGHAAGVVGLFGFGHLSFERWGHALLVVVEGPPEIDDERLGLAALLGGLLSSLANREAACVPLPQERYLVVDPAISEQVWGWANEGADLLTILDRLVPGESP